MNILEYTTKCKKYTVFMNAEYQVKALRHGEPWFHYEAGNSPIIDMLNELEDNAKEIAELKSKLAELKDLSDFLDKTREYNKAILGAISEVRDELVESGKIHDYV